jgi:hypothetical protein
MRQFALINSIGQRYDLMDTDYFLYDPEGLGFKKGTKYQEVGNIFVPYLDRYKQPEPKGIIRFDNPGAYDKYYEFARFISKAPIRLEYTPADATYYLDCIVSELKKTELQGEGLNCEIEFNALGFYYQVTNLVSADDDTNGKVYGYTYNYQYSDVMPGTVVKDVDSMIESPCIITIYGPAINPVWRHYVNNVLIATGKCNITLLTGHNLVINTASATYSITEQDEYGNVIFDRYQDSDFSTERFFLLRNGNNRIAVAHDGVMPPKLKVETRLLYETV